MAHIVWVLGAGFSRGLGGPLLSDLFSEASELKRRIYFDQTRLNGELSDRAVQLYRFGVVGGNSRLPTWRDAEAYLDELDTAARAGANSKKGRT